MDDTQDIPEQVGSLGAWLQAPNLAPSTAPRRKGPWEIPSTPMPLPAPTPSQPIPIPSRPVWRERRNQSFNLFEPHAAATSPHLATSSGGGEHRPLQPPAHLLTLVDPIGSGGQVSIHPDSLPCSLLGAPAADSEDCGSAERCYGWPAHEPCSPSTWEQEDELPRRSEPRDVPQRKLMGRLLDGYQITAGPLGPAASLPTQGTQALVGLANLCKALSSPPAQITREANTENATLRRGGAGGAGLGMAVVAAASGLSAAFDAARAIAAFERSTAWAMALQAGDGGGGGAVARMAGSRLDCMAFGAL